MQSLKEFLGSQKQNRDAQLLADITTDISNFRLNANFKFVDNFKIKIDEDSSYKLSLYFDTLSEKALGLNWSGDEIAAISYWSDYSSTPQQPTKNVLFNEALTLKNIKPILNAVYERLLSCKEDKKLLENENKVLELPKVIKPKNMENFNEKLIISIALPSKRSII